ncbi:hypothetical protein Ptr902_08722 [Pyrenophora tritici-repentis]|nr:hypothetical protein PtrV1_02972 [Pyrenophora tritici-repentis]KAI2479457.1 hypothetical protein Ptr902_08722 [Pyrenophora tritici-repentis]
MKYLTVSGAYSDLCTLVCQVFYDTQVRTQIYPRLGNCSSFQND